MEDLNVGIGWMVDVDGGCGCRKKRGVEGVYVDLEASKGGFSEDLPVVTDL